MNEGKLLVLVLKDLSATFHTIDHDILLHRLHHIFSIQGTVLSWFRYCLIKRFQIVSIKSTHSYQNELCNSVLQSNVLVPILLILYTQPLTSVIFKHSIFYFICCMLMPRMYKTFDLNECLSSVLCVEKWISEDRIWMMSSKF